ncbi:MAG TPA: macro domain-containing protein [Candidatus Fimousia stercorigallinarum]|nr:macro domain-containing protein [Candidatus Fimousia stercorigallinarum]
MPFLLIRDDITKVHADVIVNPANTKLQQGDGTSRAIYLAAGEEKLTEACRKIGSCAPGKAVITEGFGLSAKYIIHAVGPVWRGGFFGEKKRLYHTYMEVLKLAKEYQAESIAFPLLSSGSYGYPKDKALNVAISAISDFLIEHDMRIYMVLYDQNSVKISRKLFHAIEEYIDDHYVKSKEEVYHSPQMRQREWMIEHEDVSMMPMGASVPMTAKKKGRKLEDLMKHMGETFSQMLLRLIDEKGYTDAQIYHKANIDRRHFSKIRKNAEYAPNRKTVIAFAIALELSLDEAKDLMKAAGFSFSDSTKFDVIIQFFLENRIYDVFEINEVLFSYEQPLIGG